MTNPAEDPDFSALLRQQRLAARLTQEALAERAGVSARTVQDLERGVARPLRGTARRLADALALRGERREQFDRIAAPVPRARRAGRGLPPRHPDASPGDVGDDACGQVDLDGERRQVTILVAEVAGATDSAEGLELDVADRLLTRAVPLLVEVVQQCGGTVNRVDGDGLMALFGAPRAREDDAVRACTAALALHEAFDRFTMRSGEERGVSLTLRIGLASGDIILRGSGSTPYREGTALGPAVRAAMRLGQVAAVGSALLTAETLRLTEGYIDVRPADPVPGIGPGGPAEIFELTGCRPETTRFQRVVGTRQLSRFVGRESELASLTAALGRTRDGHGQIVALVGEPGVGKSRLIWEVSRSARTNGWSVLETGAVSHGPVSAYRPAIDLVKSYCHIEPGDDGASVRERLTERILGLDRALEPDLPALRALLDLPVEDTVWAGLDPPQRRRRMLDAVRRLLLRESQEQPLVLVFEDLHWIDSETQALLNGLVESIPAARILLLVSYRPEYEHPWFRKTYYSQVRVDALPTASANDLLGVLLGEDVALQPLKQLLIAKSEGNPLFLEESVRSLVEAGVLVGERGAYRQARPIDTIRVPDTIQTVLAARIDRLDPEAKRLLQLASVIGKEIPLSLLRAIVHAPDEQLEGKLARLLTTELLYEAQLFPESRYTFKHALTHDVAYGGLLHDRRRALHAQVATAIERLYPDRLAEHVERLAHHAVRGEMWEKAVAYARQAGFKAIARSANRAAIGHFDQALVALGHMPESHDTLRLAVDLRLDLRPAFIPVGEFDRVMAVLREAEDIAERLGDQHRLGRTLSFLQFSYFLLGEHDRAIETGERALAIGRAIDDVPIQVVAAHLVAFPHRLRGAYRRAIEVSAWVAASVQGALLRERFGVGGYPASAARGVAAGCLAELGEFAEGTAYGTEAIRIAETLGHPYGLAAVQLLQGYLYYRQGRLVEAIGLLDTCLDLFQRRDLPQLVPEVRALLGAAYVMNSQAANGIELLEQATSHLDVQRVGTLIPHVTVVSEGYLLAGRLDEASRLAEDALEGARQRRERGVEADCLRLLGEVACRRTPVDFKVAEAHYRSALDLAQELEMRPLQAHCHRGLGKLYRRLDRLDESQMELSTAIEMLREMGMRFWLPDAERELSELSR